MYKQSIASKASNLFSKLIIAVYVYFRKQPSTKIRNNFWIGDSGKNYLNIKGKSKWQEVLRINSVIDSYISTYDISHYKGTNLYNIDSAYRLNKALELIQYGVIEPTDFMSDKPISKVVTIDGTDYMWEHMKDDAAIRAKNDISLDNKARQAASTTEEYHSLHVAFMSYKEWLYRNETYTKQIDRIISNYGISEYLGQNLYDISSEKYLKEAFSAIITMTDLYNVGVYAYKGSHITTLSNFALEKIWDQHNDDNFDGLEFDADTRKTHLDEMAKAEKEYQQKKEQQLKRNAAARERRAKLKAEAMRAQNKKKPKPAAAKATSKKSSRKVQTV